MTNKDMAAIIPVDDVESSQRQSDTQNDEQIANMAQEIKILKEELRQIQDLTKLIMASFPTQFRAPSIELPMGAPVNIENPPLHAQAPSALNPLPGLHLIVCSLLRASPF